MIRRVLGEWRREPESNRPKRLCRPLHNRFAIAPAVLTLDLDSCLLEHAVGSRTGRSARRYATLALLHGPELPPAEAKTPGRTRGWKTGAGKGARTLDLNLGKVALYQLSYSREISGGRYSRAWSPSVNAEAQDVEKQNL